MLIVMAGPDTTTHPIQTLYEKTVKLEGAITSCLAKATPKAVHELRSSIRRIEAQCELVEQISGLPLYRERRGQVDKCLKKMRRLAGTVRDIDVQVKLIEENTPAEQMAGADAVVHRLKARREREAKLLVDALQKGQAKVGRAINRLLKSVKAKDELALSAAQLVATVRRWFDRHRGSARTIVQLHQARKSAKLARYMAEGSPESARAKRVAKDYERMQSTGGRWHDWAVLVETTAAELRKKHPLLREFERHRDTELRAYRRALARFHGPGGLTR
jgi:CHAD domain-containing protein